MKHTVKHIVHKWSSSRVGLKLIDGEEGWTNGQRDRFEHETQNQL